MYGNLQRNTNTKVIILDIKSRFYYTRYQVEIYLQIHYHIL